MKVIYKGKQVTLDNKDSLGAGGEANVIKKGNLAFKIYHQPTSQKFQKLNALIKKDFNSPFIPDHIRQNIALPIDIVFNMKKKPIGFTMNVLNGCTEIMKLSNRVYRKKENIHSNTVMCILHSLKLTLDMLHFNGVVVGDLSDLNILFRSLESIFIDVDSYQFDKFPCPVGTEQFIDPNLFGFDLEKRPYFSQETDWYSFAVILFKSLLLVHPYGGVHKTCKNMVERIKQKITVFDKDVIYPKIGITPDTLSDDFLHYFDSIFSKGKRLNISIQMLDKLSFTECKKCGLYFSDERSKCPGCQKVIPKQTVDLTQIITKKQVDKAGCQVSTLFETTGNILFSKVIDNKLIVVAYEDLRTVLYIITETKQEKIDLWAGHLKNIKYDFFQNYLTMSDHTKDLLIFEIKNGQRNPITKTTTELYNEMPVYACSTDSLYRIAGTTVMKSRVEKGRILEETFFPVFENQTWLSMGIHSLGLGFFRIFDKFVYFVFSDEGRYEIDLPKLDGKTIEADARSSIHSSILLRKNLYNGRTYSHYHLVNSKGKVLETKSEESLNSELLKNIYGKELAGSNIIHPSDAGIVIEKHGNLTLKTETANYVDAYCSLLLYRSGILVISDNKISYLVLK